MSVVATLVKEVRNSGSIPKQSPLILFPMPVKKQLRGSMSSPPPPSLPSPPYRAGIQPHKVTGVMSDPLFQWPMTQGKTSQVTPNVFRKLL